MDSRADVEARTLMAKAIIDPVLAQQRAQDTYDGGVDWSRADWSNPLLKQLANLSALSNHDMPQTAHMRRRMRSDLPAEHSIVESAAASLSTQAQSVTYVSDLELHHAEGCDSAGASSLAHVYGVPSPTRSQPSVAELAAFRLRPPPTLASTTAPPLSPTVTAATASLMHLSTDTIAADPELGALIRRIAQQREASDPRARQMLSGSVVQLPDETDQAKKSAAERLRDESLRPSVRSPNRAFRESDIRTYDTLSTRGEALRSMHDVDRITWFERAVEVGATAEDGDQLTDYHEELTAAMGRLQAVELRIEHLMREEMSQRPALIQPTAVPAIDDAPAARNNTE
jgi:hypothetical protein